MTSRSPNQHPRGDKKAWFALAVAASALIVSLILVSRPRHVPSDSEVVTHEERFEDPPDQSVSDGYVRIGGVDRPITDLKPKFDKELKPPGDQQQKFIGYGTSPRVDPESNDNTRSVSQALKTGRYPERLSSMIAPQLFDKEAWDANPQAYLSVVEPGRVFQPAQPGPQTPRLQRLTSRLSQIEQGETVPLQVRAVPGAPVSFSSFDLGAFDNKLTAITVRADKDGVATTRFTGTPGTINDVNILAASPMVSGQVKFVVNVARPKPAGTPVAVQAQ